MIEHCEQINEVTARDPHVGWWVEFCQMRFDLEKWLAVDAEEYRTVTGRAGDPGDDDDPEYFRIVGRMSDLTDLILVTPAKSFAGARIQWRLVIEEFGPDTGTAGDKALANLRCFVSRVETVLKRRDRLAEVEGWVRDDAAPPAAA